VGLSANFYAQDRVHRNVPIQTFLTHQPGEYVTIHRSLLQRLCDASGWDMNGEDYREVKGVLGGK